MNRFLLIATAVVLVAIMAQPAAAQSTNPIMLGLRAGLNLGNASLSPDLPAGVSKSNRTGIVGGGYAEFGVAEGVFITGEVLYLQGGLKETFGSTEGTGKFDFLVIPISAKYKFNIENSMVKPFIFAGPNIGLRMKAEFDSGGQTEDVKDSTESFDFGIHFGAGVEYEVSPGVNIFLDGRYGLGLKDIDKTSGSEAKARNISIMAGVSFKVN
jgi:opacity protein-like surface antigen